MSDDAALLRRYVEEQAEDAFTELVRRHVDAAYSTALRRVGGDTHLAEDVTQQVFAALARQAKFLVDHPALTAWLYTSTRNIAANVVRTEQRRKRREQESHAMQNSSDETTPVDWTRIAPVLDDAIDQLSEADRIAVLLRFIERRAFAEIGAALRVSEDAARMRLERALEKLRGLLARRGVTWTASALAVALSGQAVIAAPAGLAATVTAFACVPAGAAAVAVPAFQLFQIMTASKLVLCGAALTAALSLGLAIRKTHHAHAIEQALAAACAERDSLRAQAIASAARVEEWAQREREWAKQRAELEKKIDGIQIAPVKASSGDESHDLESAIERLVIKSPELQQLYVRQQTIRIRPRYGPFYRTASLSAGEIDRFERAKRQFAEATIDVNVARVAQGLAKDDPAIVSLTQQAAERRDQELRSLLGDERFRALRKYDRTFSARSLANNLATELYYTEAPLTAAQADELTRIVVEATAGLKKAVDWNALARAAEPSLSPVQMAALRTRIEMAELGARVYEMTKPARPDEKADSIKK